MAAMSIKNKYGERALADYVHLSQNIDTSKVQRYVESIEHSLLPKSTRDRRALDRILSEGAYPS